MITLENQNLKIQTVTKSKLKGLNPEELRFGRDFSDHMYISDCLNNVWSNNRIEPFGDLSMSPAMCSLHYGQAIFEGMKAYKGKDGKIRLFRPFENAKRFNISATRMCMPEIPEEHFVSAIRELIKIDAAWVPDLEGCSLYIRPFMFGDEVFLGVKPSAKYKFMIICSPASSYYHEPIKVKIETKYSRASVGGTGYAKAAGNYAAALYPAKLAAEKGYQQLIWTDAVEHKYIEEAGTMNIMVLIDGVLITPSLEKETILDGITRDSVIQVAKSLGHRVEERKLSVAELIEASKKGKLMDVFGMGTAANIAPIISIGTEAGEIELPPVSERKVSNEIADILSKIKYGEIDDTFGWIEEI